MFNFFNEIKSKFDLAVEGINEYKIINISNKILYVEGQKGIIAITDSLINFKVYHAVITIYGNNLKVKECTNDTLAICGEILKVEKQWLKVIFFIN